MIDEKDSRRTLVWDLPTRLFHWLLVVLVTLSVVTGKTGDMDLHAISGFAILALVLFRLIWGVIGGRHARFADFLKGPGAVFAYIRGLLAGTPQKTVGHNPLGGWSVLLMVVLLGTQASLGLFANDDILTEGPLVKYITKDTSDFVTWLHYLNSNALLAVVAVHVAAAFYYLFKGDNLIVPMVTGSKRDVESLEQAPAVSPPLWRAMVAAALATAAVYLIVNA